MTPRVAYDWETHADRLAFSPSGTAFYLPGGKAPAAGRTLRLPALARTLDSYEIGAERWPQPLMRGMLSSAMPRCLA